MRWDDFRRSDNVEDDREQRSRRPYRAGPAASASARSSIIGLISWYFGIDPSVLLNGAQILTGGGDAAPRQQPPAPTAPPARRTIGPATSSPPVLGDTEDRWKEIFAASGTHLSSAAAASVHAAPSRGGCGLAQSAMGPFYCPHDQRIYLDTSFFDDLQNEVRRLRQQQRPASSREAYVIAHEVGHHVQDELGILPRVQQVQQASTSKRRANRAAGARRAAGRLLRRHLGEPVRRRKHNFLDPGDVDQALQTASAIGDDRLQKQSQGYVVPDAFTHGTSEQRKRWFLSGFKQGKISACNTFRGSPL